MGKHAYFRMYEELNDFLPRERRKTTFMHAFTGKPSVKDAIEGLGVPHTGIDLILLNGEPVTFDAHLADGDRVAVYPVFESIDISPIARLRPAPLRTTRFILDAHLGKCARMLRILGFDTLFRDDGDASAIIATSLDEHRIIITRHAGLLKHRAVTHGYWLRATRTNGQVAKILDRFDLHGRIAPFTRCTLCNGEVENAAPDDIAASIGEGTRAHYTRFTRCTSCGKVYWQGSHTARMRRFIDGLTASRDRS